MFVCTLERLRAGCLKGDAAMARWFLALVAGALALCAAGPSRADDKNSLGSADVVGTITATEKVEENIERSPVIGYITVDDRVRIAVGVGTSITEGPGDLVGRGFGSLKKGRKVEVVMARSGKMPIAAQINILPGAPADK
jgi:hypothetical protein